MDAGQSSLHPFVRLSREDWARLPTDASFALSEDDLRKIGTHLSREETSQVYLPLSRLLYLHVSATQSLYRAARAFLAAEEKEVPYVVGIAGSVAAGKSTVALVLRDLISRWPGRVCRRPTTARAGKRKAGTRFGGGRVRVRPA
jgi:type I pantothenate kinase